MTWDEFIEANRQTLEANYGHELVFVEKILRKVPGLDPVVVTCQKHFSDGTGGNRFIDFAIQLPKSAKIAIEIDGFDKWGDGLGPTPERHDDLTRRQTALASQGWIVLRFTNRNIRYRQEESLALVLQTMSRIQAEEAANANRRVLDAKQVARAVSLAVEEEMRRLNARGDEDLRKLAEEVEGLKALKSEPKATAIENQMHRLNARTEDELRKLASEIEQLRVLKAEPIGPASAAGAVGSVARNDEPLAQSATALVLDGFRIPTAAAVTAKRPSRSRAWVAGGVGLVALSSLAFALVTQGPGSATRADIPSAQPSPPPVAPLAISRPAAPAPTPETEQRPSAVEAAEESAHAEPKDELNRLTAAAQPARADQSEKVSTRCGLVAQVAVHADIRPSFINFGDRFPRQAFAAELSATVRDELQRKYRDLDAALVGRAVCVKGSIEGSGRKMRFVLANADAVTFQVAAGAR